MKISFSNGTESPNGFIYVASRNVLYYELGLLSAQSLKDFSPDTHITLFTHEKFLDKRCEIFDRVITDIPVHYRAKMWCMARTPYQRTIYNDCDSQICHRDVSKMFDFLDNCDLFCGSNLLYTVGSIKWAYIDIARNHIPKYHGSMWGYHNTELIRDFMQTWFDEYIKQITNPWPEPDKYYPEWQKFDMFTLWKISCGLFDEFKRFNELKIDILSRRWNGTGQDLMEDLDGPPVIKQIDKSTYRKMPVVGEILEKSERNEKYQFTQQKVGIPITEYN